MKPSERIAQLVLEHVYPDARIEFSVQQHSSQCDFAVTFSDGRAAAVEVTTSTDEQLEATAGDLRKHGRVIEAARCRYTWMVEPLPSARMNEIRRRIDDYLFRIEMEGFEQFFAPLSYRVPSVSRIYNDLKIEAASIVNRTPPGRILISDPSHEGGIIEAGHVQRAVETEANKPDNRHKLAAAAACSERHLFVYISARHFLPWVALVDNCTPELPPSLPHAITHAWAATEMPGNGITVRIAQPDTGWRNLGIISSLGRTSAR